MNILFLGGVFYGKMKDEVIENSKQYIQYAADKLQWNIINGLEANGGNITILNMPFVGVYPVSYKSMYVNPYKFSHNGISDDVSVGFMNLRLVHKIFKYSSLSRQLKKCLSTLQKRNQLPDAIIIYSVDSVFLNVAKLAKHLYPSINICLVAPDLPEYMNLNDKQSLLGKITKKVDLFLIDKSLKIVDSFVLITEHMAAALNAGTRPYTIVEGMVPLNTHESELKEEKQDKVKTILYTGTLTKKYGIMHLLSAFSLIENQDYRLVICGSGEAEPEVKAACISDSRVAYRGLLSPEEIAVMQKQATVLVNPRQNDNGFTKYSFPSKIMEYLLSGTATVAYKLSGMPNEYDDYIFYIEGDSPKHMADKLVQVCEMDQKERSDFAGRAKNFVLNNKNNIVQSEKILNMLRHNN